MSLSFYIDNAHFAIGLIGAVAFLMAAWLSFDTYALRREFTTFARGLGLAACALFEIIAAVGAGSDVLSYFGLFLFLIGLLLIVASFLGSRRLAASSVVVLPAFSVWSAYLADAASFLLILVALLSFQHGRREFNKSWRPFSLAFVCIAVGTLLNTSSVSGANSMLFVAGDIVALIGFLLLARWVWQFLQLRIRESLTLIFISVSLFLATVVTLAFSTILVGQVVTETDTSLLADARVLNLDVGSLEQEALAQTQLIAGNQDLAAAVAANDFPSLEQLATNFLQSDGLGFVTITDGNGVVLIRGNALSQRGDTLVDDRAFEEAQLGNPFVTVEDSAVEKLSIRAGAPIVVKGKTIGVVIAGYPLDNVFVDNLKRITGLDMFVYEGGTSVAASAFASDGRTRLVGVSAPSSVVASVMGNGTPQTAQAIFFGLPYQASYLPLVNGDGKTIGMLSAAQSEQDILNIENATNRLTLITVILIMLALSAPLYILTKRFTETL